MCHSHHDISHNRQESAFVLPGDHVRRRPAIHSFEMERWRWRRVSSERYNMSYEPITPEIAQKLFLRYHSYASAVSPHNTYVRACVRAYNQSSSSLQCNQSSIAAVSFTHTGLLLQLLPLPDISLRPSSYYSACWLQDSIVPADTHSPHPHLKMEVALSPFHSSPAKPGRFLVFVPPLSCFSPLLFPFIPTH